MKRVLVALVVLLACSTLLADVAANAQHARAFTGEVRTTQGSDSRRVLVMVDTFTDGRGDGIVDQWFVLEAGEPLAMVLRVPAADLLHVEGRLRIVSKADRRVYDFFVTGYEPTVPVPENFTSVRHEGIGLSHSSGETKVPIGERSGRGRVRANDECDFCDPLGLDPSGGESGGGGTPSCDAGGSGSSACSISSGSHSCSVTCSSGNYACCQTVSWGVSCKCHKN